LSAIAWNFLFDSSFHLSNVGWSTRDCWLFRIPCRLLNCLAPLALANPVPYIEPDCSVPFTGPFPLVREQLKASLVAFG
jgi:hypothetical protein